MFSILKKGSALFLEPSTSERSTKLLSPASLWHKYFTKKKVCRFTGVMSWCKRQVRYKDRFNTILTKIFLPFNVFSKMKSEKLDVFFSISGGQVWIPGGQRIKGKKGPVKMFSGQKEESNIMLIFCSTVFHTRI